MIIALTGVDAADPEEGKVSEKREYDLCLKIRTF